MLSYTRQRVALVLRRVLTTTSPSLVAIRGHLPRLLSWTHRSKHSITIRQASAARARCRPPPPLPSIASRRIGDLNSMLGRHSTSRKTAPKPLLAQQKVGRLNRSSSSSSSSLFTSSSSSSVPPVKYLPAKGFATGALAGAFGSWVRLGGGFVSLPILTMALRLTQHQAHGTSLCAVTATGFAGVR